MFVGTSGWAKLAWAATLLAVYLALFGVGARMWWMCGVGGAVGLLALALRVFGRRRTALLRTYVFGTARVVSASPPPTAGLVGRCEMHLAVLAPGIDEVSVRVLDPAVPVSKWPAEGATLPIEVHAVNPRRTRVLWDRVLTHAEAVDGPR